MDKSLLKILFTGLWILTVKPVYGAITVNGPVTAVGAIVSGGVTISSITVSTLTLSTALSASGANVTMSGRIIQLRTSSTTVTTSITSSTFSAITSLSQTMSLSRPNNYVRISLSGNLLTQSASQPGYITIYRDSTNLGDSSLGLSAALASLSAEPYPINTAGITFIDRPGDTNTHTYQVYLRASSPYQVDFPFESVGYLLLEEISQ